MNNTDFSARSSSSVSDLAVRAAREAFDRGGSPRAQLDAARQASRQKLTYRPHNGSREMARRLARMEQNATSETESA